MMVMSRAPADDDRLRDVVTSLPSFSIISWGPSSVGGVAFMRASPAPRVVAGAAMGIVAPSPEPEVVLRAFVVTDAVLGGPSPKMEPLSADDMAARLEGGRPQDRTAGERYG